VTDLVGGRADGLDVAVAVHFLQSGVPADDDAVAFYLFVEVEDGSIPGRERVFPELDLLEDDDNGHAAVAVVVVALEVDVVVGLVDDLPDELSAPVGREVEEVVVRRVPRFALLVYLSAVHVGLVPATDAGRPRVQRDLSVGRLEVVVPQGTAPLDVTRAGPEPRRLEVFRPVGRLRVGKAPEQDEHVVRGVGGHDAGSRSPGHLPASRFGLLSRRPRVTPSLR
jgi:hypothetical protein